MTNKIKVLKPKTVEKVLKINELVESGEKIGKACAIVGLSTPVYYRYRMSMKNDDPNKVAVHVHEALPVQKRKYVKKETAASPSAIFIGDPESCARFMKEFKQ